MYTGIKAILKEFKRRQDAEAQKKLVYSYNEMDTGKIWVDGSRIFRKVVDCGQLPNNASKVVNTGVKIKNLVKLEGCAFSPSENAWVLLPHSAATSLNIGIAVLNNSIEISTNSDRTDYTSSYVIMEYTKAE